MNFVKLFVYVCTLITKTNTTMNEETLLDELNDLCENVLCPMDLMDSITDYTNQKIIDELQIGRAHV